MSQAILIGASIIPLLICLRSKQFWRTLLFTALTGITALAVVCWLGAYTGVFLTMNPFTIICSIILGIPGVIAMLLLRIIFQL